MRCKKKKKTKWQIDSNFKITLLSDRIEILFVSSFFLFFFFFGKTDLPRRPGPSGAKQPCDRVTVGLDPGPRMTEKPRVVSACMKRIVRSNGRAQQKPLISGKDAIKLCSLASLHRCIVASLPRCTVASLHRCPVASLHRYRVTRRDVDAMGNKGLGELNHPIYFFFFSSA